MAMTVAMPSGLSSDVQRYIRSIFDHQLHADVDLPSFSGPIASFTRQVRSSTVQLTAGSVLVCAFIANPYLAWSQYMNYQTQVASLASPQLSFVPAFATNGTASSAGVPYGDGTSANTYSPMLLDGPVFAGTTSTFGSATVRVHGMEIDIEYVGTELNKGGALSIIHGANDVSCYSQYATTGNTVGSFGGLISLVTPCNDAFATTCRMGNRVRFVLRPTDPSFFTIRDTYFAGESISGLASATVTITNSAADAAGVLPLDGTGAGPTAQSPNFRAPHGWTQGFMLNPANGAAGLSLPYILRVRVVTDEYVNLQSANPVGFNEGAPNRRAVSNPLAEAHIRNALSAHHLAVSNGLLREVAAKSEAAFGPTVSAAAAGAAESIGEKAMAAVFKTSRGHRL